MDANDGMIGAVRVTRVEEMCGPIVSPRDWFSDFDEEELARHLTWLAPRYYEVASQRMISSIHSWILRTPRRVILIDTCTGNHKVRPGWDAFHMLNTPYLERLQAAGVAPEDVDVVLCTHLHVDHVGWNTRLDGGRWVPTFPNAQYLMSRADHDYFASTARDAETPELVRNTYNDSVLPVVEQKLAVMVEGTEELADGLRLVPAPGHTPGQVRLDLSSAGQRAVFCGDVLHHPSAPTPTRHATLGARCWRTARNTAQCCCRRTSPSRMARVLPPKAMSSEFRWNGSAGSYLSSIGRPS